MTRPNRIVTKRILTTRYTVARIMWQARAEVIREQLRQQRAAAF